MTAHDETLVREALHHATDDLTTSVPSLTATAAVRGRRLRRRRRVMAAAGTFCATVLVAVPIVASLGSDSTEGTQVATDPTPTPSATPTAEVLAPGMIDNDAWATMPAAEMAAHFETLAPEGIGLTDVMLTNVDRGPAEPETDNPGLLLGRATTDGTVSGSVNMMLTVTGFSASKYTCPGDLRHPDSCTEILGDDGLPIGRRSVTTSAGGVIDHEVVLLRENGGLVYADATNATSNKWGGGSPIAGPDVPLTLDQLQAIAEDDVWIGYAPPTPSQ